MIEKYAAGARTYMGLEVRRWCTRELASQLHSGSGRKGCKTDG